MDKHLRPGQEPIPEPQPAEVPMGPMGADEVAAAQFVVGQPSGIPARTPDHFVCLRGPCRHYWHLVGHSEAGNPAGTWEALGVKEPRHHYHTCLLNPGCETSFENDNAYECSRWDPIEPAELVQLNARREMYYQAHPEHRPEPPDDGPEDFSDVDVEMTDGE